VAIPKFVLVVAVVAVCLVPGCAAPNPATYSCTPEVGGEPYACVKEQYDLMVERNKLYAEAEAVYRRFLAEDERLYRAGGIDTPTAVLLETTTGDFLKGQLGNYQQVRRTQGTSVGGEFKIVWFKRIPDQVRDGSIVALKGCFDNRTVMMGAKGKQPRPGTVFEETGFFVRDGELLKLTESTYKEVSTC
jgi:hypothetical protein